MRKVGNATVSDSYFTAKNAVYAEQMARELAAIPREKKPPTTTQAASTQAILSRDPSQDEHHFNRPLPLNWKARPDLLPDGIDFNTLSEAEKDSIVAARKVSAEEIRVEEQRRRGSKNTLGDAVSEGATSVSPESRDRAIDAFYYSPSSELTHHEKEKLKALTPYSPLPPQPVETPKKQSLAGCISHWFWKRGVPVYRFSKKELSLDKANKE